MNQGRGALNPKERDGADRDTIKPIVFRYHDYTKFLADHIAYLKNTKRGFALKKIADEAGVSLAFVTMVLKRHRKFSDTAWTRFTRELKLNQTELNYLDLIRLIADSDSHEQRLEAYQKIRKMRQYRSLNSKELEVSQYLTDWYYVAIREMVELPNFRMDPSWIQSQLKTKVPIQKIRTALKFLIDHEYITRTKNGRIVQVERDGSKAIECSGGIYRLSISNCHRSFLKMVGEAIDNTDRSQREIASQTLAVTQEQFDKIKEILEEARSRISNVVDSGSTSNTKSVYHVSLNAIPITREAKTSEGEDAA